MSRSSQRLDTAIDQLVVATNAKDKRAMARIIRNNYGRLRGACSPRYPALTLLLDHYDAGGLGDVDPGGGESYPGDANDPCHDVPVTS